MDVYLLPLPIHDSTFLRSPSSVHEDHRRICRKTQPKFLTWRRPNPGIVVINCDGSFRASNGTGGYGFIIRDHYGRCILANAVNFQKTNLVEDYVEVDYGIIVMMIEMLAILSGLHFAKKMGLMHVEVQSDSKIAISIMHGSAKCLLQCLGIYFDILAEMSFFKWVGFVFVYRECNRAADFLSKFDCADGKQCFGMSELPDELKRIIAEDALGFVNVRYRMLWGLLTYGIRGV